MRDPDFQIPGYLDRWHLFRDRPKSQWNVYLHHILAPDPGEDLHDHPSWSISIVLRGGYLERLTEDKVAVRWNGGLGRIRFRRATDAHQIVSVEPDTWTIWIRGGHRRMWGFWTKDGWVPWNEYENADRSA